MNNDQLRGFHEIVFGSKSPHILVHFNSQTDNYENHWHTPLEILIPIENGYTAYVNGKKYDLNPYDILIVTPNVYHAYEAPETGVRYFVQIDINVLKDILGVNQIISRLNPSACFTPENAPEIHEKLKNLVLDICNTYYSAAPPLTDPIVQQAAAKLQKNRTVIETDVPEVLIYSKLLEFFYTISGTSDASLDARENTHLNNQDFINKFTFICNYIDEHRAEPLSCEQMAKMANFSKYHFSRLFKEFTNESFYRYVNIKRIQYAEQLLLHQNMSVTDIALSCGYSNASSFIRMFKQINGTTPRDFREHKNIET